MTKKDATVTITKDELIAIQAEALTAMTLRNPATILLADEFAEFGARMVNALFKEN